MGKVSDFRWNLLYLMICSKLDSMVKYRYTAVVLGTFGLLQREMEKRF